MPVSSFRWSGTPSGSGTSSKTASSSLASRACAISRFDAGPITRMRVVEKSRRSASASATVAMQSAVAPAPSAASAMLTAPCP